MIFSLCPLSELRPDVCEADISITQTSLSLSVSLDIILATPQPESVSFPFYPLLFWKELGKQVAVSVPDTFNGR